MKVDTEQLICLFCIHSKAKVEKKPADKAGLNSKSTEDFSDPQIDQAPQDDGKKNLPVKPER